MDALFMYRHFLKFPTCEYSALTTEQIAALTTMACGRRPLHTAQVRAAY